jgi:hypothetical protein
MALDFYSQEDAFCETENYLAYWELEPQSPHLLDSFKLGEFDKLTPWIDSCNQQGIKLGHFFDDTVLNNHQLPQCLANLRRCYGEIAHRRPFVHPSDIHKDAYVRMVAVLQTAIEQKRGIIALCD